MGAFVGLFVGDLVGDTDGAAVSHTPPTQPNAPQSLPHAPQLEGLFPSVSQPSSNSCEQSNHGSLQVKSHTPLTHVAASTSDWSKQLNPHSPQFNGSISMSN